MAGDDTPRVAPSAPPRATRSRALLFRVIAALLACVLAIGFAEVAARLLVGDRVVFNRPDRWQPHPKLGAILRPDHTFEASGARYATNALHLRDRLYDPEPPSDVFRVMVVGDSFVHGIGPLETIFPRVLEPRLAERLHRPVEVMAVGLPGYGTIQQNLYLEQYLDAYRCDLLVLAFCVGNDLDENRRFAKREHLEDRSRDKRSRRAQRQSLWSWSKLYQLYRSRRKSARRADEDRFLDLVADRMDLADPAFYADGTPGRAALDRTIEEILKMRTWAAERQAPFALLLLPEEYQLDAGLRERAAGRREEAREIRPRLVQQQIVAELTQSLPDAAAEIIDPLDRFASDYEPGRYYLLRDTHFDAAGNDLAAEVLADWIVEGIGDDPPPRRR